ncbi:hypothetical protein HOY80DRAFT_1957 [Tuber brumale]|nr:hypothetical protein HOY80DRAFT_1957 [Tuber brumale]
MTKMRLFMESTRSPPKFPNRCGREGNEKLSGLVVISLSILNLITYRRMTDNWTVTNTRVLVSMPYSPPSFPPFPPSVLLPQYRPPSSFFLHITTFSLLLFLHSSPNPPVSPSPYLPFSPCFRFVNFILILAYPEKGRLNTNTYVAATIIAMAVTVATADCSSFFPLLFYFSQCPMVFARCFIHLFSLFSSIPYPTSRETTHAKN